MFQLAKDAMLGISLYPPKEAPRIFIIPQTDNNGERERERLNFRFLLSWHREIDWAQSDFHSSDSPISNIESESRIHEDRLLNHGYILRLNDKRCEQVQRGSAFLPERQTNLKVNQSPELKT